MSLLPIIDLAIKELTGVEDALEATIKYQIVETTVILEALLHTFGPGEPLKVFVILCHLQLEVEAKAAVPHLWFGTGIPWVWWIFEQIIL